MARRAVPARVQRAEQMLKDIRITLGIAPLNAARTAQRAIPTLVGRPYKNSEAGRREPSVAPGPRPRASEEGAGKSGWLRLGFRG
jgi:hypothetical protein